MRWLNMQKNLEKKLNKNLEIQIIDVYLTCQSDENFKNLARWQSN